jgi:KaiC/GvpD/RAD55 family RecA-like ATPase
LWVTDPQLGGVDYLIKGLLPARSIALLVGDSGLGKSPLVYQAGLCVAAGVPFLGLDTTKASVVICDFENGIVDILELLDRIAAYLGLAGLPDNLYVWTLNDCLERYRQSGHTLIDIIDDVKPALAIIDSIGSYLPEAEEKNSAATRMLQEFRSLARDHGTTTLGVHHRRKQSRKPNESAGPIESANLRDWFQDARGASTLINGSDYRLGVDEPFLGATDKADLSLVLRGFGRIRGEIGPLYLTRDSDEDGDPIGYRRLRGSELLFNKDQQEALEGLPQGFSFKNAKQAYGRADQATSNWLRRCIDLQLVHKVSRGVYAKTLPKVGPAMERA